MDVFVRTEDVGRVILDYIGSPEFEAAVNCTVNDGRAAFMGGLGMAGCLIIARCPRYYADDKADDKMEASE